MVKSLKISYLMAVDENCLTLDKTVNSLLATAGEHFVEIFLINIGNYNAPMLQKLRWTSRTICSYRPDMNVSEVWTKGTRYILSRNSPDFVVLCRPDFEAKHGFLKNLSKEKATYKIFVPYSNYYRDDLNSIDTTKEVLENSGGFCIFLSNYCAKLMELPSLHSNFLDRAVIDCCAKNNSTLYKLGNCYAEFVNRQSETSKLHIGNDNIVYTKFLEKNKSYEYHRSIIDSDNYVGLFGG